MMNEFWNARYANSRYAYGEKPNAYFANEINKIEGGKALFPAEGEGRNAIYAAFRGFDVVAFDPSSLGRDKALRLAKKNNVSIRYLLSSYEDVDFEKESFDVLVLIFAHMPPHLRKQYHQKLIRFVKPGGRIILQGFSKEQINRNTGGPKDVDMLFSKEELMGDFASLSFLQIEQEKIVLDEGEFHQGEASVIQFHGIK